jgi:RNA polymerase sigma-70 factor, ECF subfamily
MPSSAVDALGRNWILDPKVSQLIRRKSRQLTNQLGFSRSDRADIEQELNLELVRKAKRFDPARAQAVTFAKQIIESKAASLIRAVRAKKRGCHCVTASLNTLVADGEGRVLQLADMIDSSAGRRHTGQRLPAEAESSQLQIDLGEANQSLAPELREMVALLRLVPVFTAAKVLSISRREAAARVAKLRAHFEARGFGLYAQRA